jgi:hypothetical protein
VCLSEESIDCSMNCAGPRRRVLHMSWHFAFSVLFTMHLFLYVAEFIQNFGIIVAKIDKFFYFSSNCSRKNSQRSRFIAFVIIFYMLVSFMSALLIPLKCSLNGKDRG